MSEIDSVIDTDLMLDLELTEVINTYCKKYNEDIFDEKYDCYRTISENHNKFTPRVKIIKEFIDYYKEKINDIYYKKTELTENEEKELDEILTPKLAEEINKFCKIKDCNRIPEKIECYFSYLKDHPFKENNIEELFSSYKETNDEYDDNNNNTKIN